MSDAKCDPMMDKIVVAAINRGRAGSAEAVGSLCELYRDYLMTVAGERVTGDLQSKVSPSDLVQDTFQRAAMSFKEFQGQSEPELRAWLLQILSRRATDMFRVWYSEKRNVSLEISLSEPVPNGNDLTETELTHSIPGPVSELIRKDLVSRIHAALLLLSEDQRQVIMICCFEKENYEDAAVRLNRSTEAVRKLFFRAIEKLSTILQLDD